MFNRIFLSFFAVITFSALTTLAQAASEAKKEASGKPPSSVSKLDLIKDRFAAKFKKIRPDLEVSKVSETPAPGLYKMDLSRGGSVYVLEGGEFFVAGELFQLSDSKVVNVTQQEGNVERKLLLDKLDPKTLMSFSPKEGPVKAKITVFTDIDCGYCRKLHQEVPELNKLGVEVRYLAFPRAGLGSPSSDKIATAWCAEDKQGTMTRYKAGETVPTKVCESHPIKEHLALGEKFGVRGTPAIVLDSGELLPGYLPAKELASRLGL